MMNMSLTVILRTLLYASLAFMVYDFVKIQHNLN